MYKNANFTGQPIFSQLLNLLDRNSISRQARKHKTDYYCKKFDTHNHLITMLYAIFHKCTTTREIVTGMQACYKRLNHLGLTYSPRRSTFSDANTNRTHLVFEGIYMDLYNQYAKSLPDSRLKKNVNSRLYIIDSTTIQLFSDILKNAGCKPANGKSKGGIKVHTMIKADEDVPCVIKMTAAAKHDTPFIQGLKLPKGSIVVFDKAYVDHRQYQMWDDEKVTWVTRIRSNAAVEVTAVNELSETQKSKGILSDQEIILGHTTNNQVVRVKARMIKYHDKEKSKEFTFITNAKKLAPFTIAQIYKQRWQIELLFKRLKQNYPLNSFLGESVNAIKLQIWCTLIADFLIKVVSTLLHKKWSFSNLCSMIRIHLMSYVNLFEFLNNPEKSLINNSSPKNKGPTLFS